MTTFNTGMIAAIRRQAEKLMNEADPAAAAKAYFAQSKKEGAMNTPDAPAIKQAILDQMKNIEAEREAASTLSAAAEQDTTPASIALG